MIYDLRFESERRLAQAFWNVPPNYSDRIRRHDALNGAFLGYFTSGTPPFWLHYCTGMLLVDIGCNGYADCDDVNPCTDELSRMVCVRAR